MLSPRQQLQITVHSSGEIKAGLQVGHGPLRNLLCTFYAVSGKITMALIRSERGLARGPEPPN